MRYTASEKAEIIQLVEQLTTLPAKRTLGKFGDPGGATSLTAGMSATVRVGLEA